MDSDDLKRWAMGDRRSTSRHQRQPEPAPAPAGALPAPPPGFGYVFTPTHGYVLVPIQPVAAPPNYGYQPAPGYAPPPAQPFQPHPQPSGGGHGGRVIPMRRPQTNYLVRDDGNNSWGEALSGLPELPVDAPVGIEHYDAMDGRISPESMKALGPLMGEFPNMRTYLMDGKMERANGHVHAAPTIASKNEE